MPSVVFVACLALSLASLTASGISIKQQLKRHGDRIGDMEDRQDRANISRREDKKDLFLRMDDIEALMNSSVTGQTVKAAIETSVRQVKRDVKRLKKSTNGIKDAMEDSDRNVNNTIQSLKDSIKGNTDEILDEMKAKMNDTVSTCSKNNMFVKNKLSKLDSTLNDVKHDVKAVIGTLGREVKHDVESLNKSINGIKDEYLDETKNTIGTVLDKLNAIEKLVEEHISKSQHPVPTFSSCLGLYRAGGRTSGVYNIYQAPGQPAITVYCDMDTDGGGWTVFQRRQDGSVDFSRNWEDYAQGFGKPNGEFWLGNEHISTLTNTTCCHELRVDLEDFDGNRAFAKYSKFQVAPREENFRLEVSGYSGNASDSLAVHSGLEFTTKDRDNDKSPKNCATMYPGAWWFSRCYRAHLNGLYIQADKKQSQESGVEWINWKINYSLKLSEMKVRST